jgi:hypothetical protein
MGGEATGISACGVAAVIVGTERFAAVLVSDKVDCVLYISRILISVVSDECLGLVVSDECLGLGGLDVV